MIDAHAMATAQQLHDANLGALLGGIVFTLVAIAVAWWHVEETYREEFEKGPDEDEDRPRRDRL